MGGIAAGAFAVKKSQDDVRHVSLDLYTFRLIRTQKEAHQAGFAAWVADAEARAAQFRQYGSKNAATWILNRGKNIPAHAILVGREKSWNLYIARGYIQGSIREFFFTIVRLDVLKPGF